MSVAAKFPHPNPSASEAGEERGERQATLVVEIVVEELPPKALKSLGTAFADTLVAELRRRNVLTEASVATPYATPRRLAVAVTGVRAAAADAVAIDRLMPATIARDAHGAPSEALRRKLSSLGRGHIAAFDVDAADARTGSTFRRTARANTPICGASCRECRSSARYGSRSTSRSRDCRFRS